LDYSFDVLVLWSRKPSLYDWHCLYRFYRFYQFLSVLWCFLSSGDNSGWWTQDTV